jgi:histidyl-tRNA synthetase
LRVLDSKDPSDREVVAGAPLLADALDPHAQEFFARLLACLDTLGIRYRINPRLVRGLDYYCHTTFEFVTDALGAQGTVLAGGRYDGLVQQMGGPQTPGTGWAAGVERLMMLIAAEAAPPVRPIALVPLGLDQYGPAFRVAQSLRASGHVVELGFGASLGKQLKWANKINARLAVIVGSDELARGVASVRDMDAGAQEEVSLADLEERLAPRA